MRPDELAAVYNEYTTRCLTPDTRVPEVRGLSAKTAGVRLADASTFLTSDVKPLFTNPLQDTQESKRKFYGDLVDEWSLDRPDQLDHGVCYHLFRQTLGSAVTVSDSTQFSPLFDASVDHTHTPQALRGRLNELVGIANGNQQAQVVVQNGSTAGTHWLCFVILPINYTSSIPTPCGSHAAFNNPKPRLMLIDSQGLRSFPITLKNTLTEYEFYDSYQFTQQQGLTNCLYWSWLNTLGCITDPDYVNKLKHSFPVMPDTLNLTIGYSSLFRSFMQEVINSSLGLRWGSSRKKTIMNTIFDEVRQWQAYLTEDTLYYYLINFIDASLMRRDNNEDIPKSGQKCADLMNDDAFFNIRQLFFANRPRSQPITYADLCALKTPGAEQQRHYNHGNKSTFYQNYSGDETLAPNTAMKEQARTDLASTRIYAGGSR